MFLFSFSFTGHFFQTTASDLRQAFHTHALGLDYKVKHLDLSAMVCNLGYSETTLWRKTGVKLCVIYE